MNFTSLIADIMVQSEMYGVPAPKPSNVNMPIIIIVAAAVTIGVATGVILLIKRMLKKKNNINNAQALYGPPENFKKKSKVEPPEDLYGCPRPGDMDEEEPTDEE